MRKLILSIIILFLSSISSPSWSETFSIDDLVSRDGVFYKKFSDVPFKGKVSGTSNGKFKSGKKVGLWLVYHQNGQLSSKGYYKNGKRDGQWVIYYETGRLSSKGNFKDGMSDGPWEYWDPMGRLSNKGNYKNGLRYGQWVIYNKDRKKVIWNYKDGIATKE